MKAHARLAAAHAGMQQLDAAAAAYTTCLKLAPGNKEYTTALNDIVVGSASSNSTALGSLLPCNGLPFVA